MYLNAIYLLDICNDAGIALDQKCWDRQSTCPMTYRWHGQRKQHHPNGRQAWRRTITIALSLGRNGQLANPLRKWAYTFVNRDGYFLDPTGDQATTYLSIGKTTVDLHKKIG